MPQKWPDYSCPTVASLRSEHFDIGKIAWLGSACVKTDKIEEWGNLSN